MGIREVTATQVVEVGFLRGKQLVSFVEKLGRLNAPDGMAILCPYHSCMVSDLHLARELGSVDGMNLMRVT